MSRAVTKYLNSLKETRQTLDDWTAYEYELDRFWQSPHHSIVYDFESTIADYHHKVAIAGTALKKAMEIGGIVDLTETSLGDDIRSIADGQRHGLKLADKHRARANLVKWDFYERFGRATDATVFKFTILKVIAPRPGQTMEELATNFLMRSFQPVVLTCFTDKADAMLYRLALQ